MSTEAKQWGFTLVELLIAVALISIVLSMAYGSYVVTTKSAKACQTRIALSEQGRETLEQIARHVRCAYASSEPERKEDAQTDSDRQGTTSDAEISYFDGNAHAPNGEILSLVSTSGSFEGQETTDGLFRVVYRFDRRNRELAFSLKRFFGEAEGAQKRSWRPIAGRVTSVDMAFFNGDKWVRRWEFKNEKTLPGAVRIAISGENERLQRYDYSTVVYVSCRDSKKSAEGTRTLVSVNR